MDNGKKATTTRVVVIAVASIAVIIFLWLYFGSQGQDSTPAPPSTEWTTEPEDGVEVDLPDTPMRNVPIDSDDSAAGDTSEQEE